MSNSPAKKLLWLISFLTKPLLDLIPAHLKSSQELMERITSLPNQQRLHYNFPISLDVEALYTSIPPEAATKNLTNTLNAQNFTYYNLIPEDIESLLKIILSNAYFFYNQKFTNRSKA